MIIKTKKPKGALIDEGQYSDATVKSIKAKPDEQNPKKFIVGFAIADLEGTVFKELPTSFEANTALRKDVETLMGKEFTTAETEDGIDLAGIVGKKCQVVVAHKSGPGGKLMATVSVVLPVKDNRITINMDDTSDAEVARAAEMAI